MIKFIGFLLFIIITLSGFWCILFLLLFIVFWIFIKLFEIFCFNEKK